MEVSRAASSPSCCSLLGDFYDSGTEYAEVEFGPV
jgi:hypothetical protein